MARRTSLLKVVVKIGKEIERENKRQEKAHAKYLKAAAREEAAARRTAEREQKAENRKNLASAKKNRSLQEKEHKKFVKEIKEVLTPHTISHFKLGKTKKRKNTEFSDYSLSREIKEYASDGDDEPVELGQIKFEDFVFSGAINSVLGIDGILIFKKLLDELKLEYEMDLDLIDDYSEEVLLIAIESGIYLSSASEASDSSSKWLTSYRYILIKANLEIRSRKDLDQISDLKIPIEDQDLLDCGDLSILEQVLLGFESKIISAIKDYVSNKNSHRLVA